MQESSPKIMKAVGMQLRMPRHVGVKYPASNDNDAANQEHGQTRRKICAVKKKLTAHQASHRQDAEKARTHAENGGECAKDGQTPSPGPSWRAQKEPHRGQGEAGQKIKLRLKSPQGILPRQRRSGHGDKDQEPSARDHQAPIALNPSQHD